MEFSPFIISQILAGCAIGTDALASHAKNRKSILLFLMLSSALLAVHFYLLEEWVAAMVVVISGTRSLIASFTDSKGFLKFFLLISLISFYFLYEHWYSWIALIADIFWVISNFQKNEKILRWFMIAGTSFWIIHNSFAHTPVGVLVEVIFLINILWGYYRHHVKLRV